MGIVELYPDALRVKPAEAELGRDVAVARAALKFPEVERGGTGGGRGKTDRDEHGGRNERDLRPAPK